MATTATTAAARAAVLLLPPKEFRKGPVSTVFIDFQPFDSKSHILPRNY
ncbi:MAG: hypothetical protein K0Q93_201 [Nocardioidaceae bacterium]|jgi:hypothetical protein|nr:hypothetical protein [Nocardioidaceae bacterium]